MANVTTVNTIVSAMQENQSSKLTKAQIESMKAAVPTGAKWEDLLQEARYAYKQSKLLQKYRDFINDNVTIRIPSTTIPYALKPIITKWDEVVALKGDMYDVKEHVMLTLAVPTTAITLAVYFSKKDNCLKSKAIRTGAVSHSDTPTAISRMAMKDFQLDKLGKSLEASCNTMLAGMDIQSLLQACFRCGKLVQKDVKGITEDMAAVYGLDWDTVKACQKVARTCTVTRKADKVSA